MKRLVLILAALASTPVLATEQDEAAALKLPADEPTEATGLRDWRAYLEGAWNVSSPSSRSRLEDGKRLSFDFAMDRTLAPGWRAVLADRIDWQAATGTESAVSTLKEAYLGYQGGPMWTTEAGRINTRFGVGLGYNPTDFFRNGALRSVVSVDPASLRNNRLGAVMLRSQYVWSESSVTGLLAPKIGGGPSSATFSPDFGASNAHGRWLLAVSHAWSENLNPQLVVSGSEGRTHLGLNLSTLLGNATVIYSEWAGGREPNLLNQALGLNQDSQFYSRLTAGVTHTLVSKLSISAEFEYNGAAPDKATWEALRNGSLQASYGTYRGYVGAAQELPTRQAMMLYVTCPDIVRPRFDLTALVRSDLVDHSRMAWAELRYHWQRTDLALQWQVNSGGANTALGPVTTDKMLQLVATQYF